MLLENIMKPCRDVSVLTSNFVCTVLTVTWHKQVFYAHFEREQKLQREIKHVLYAMGLHVVRKFCSFRDN
jgi:hypothetical protein